MAESQESTLDSLRAELSKLRSQLEGIVKNADSKKSEVAEDLIDRLTRELSSLRQTAEARAHKIYDAGLNGADEVGEHVRNNPLSSLLIAFGAGCVISCLLRRLR